MKKQLLILFAFISVLALSQVPQRFNKVIVTGDITSPKFIKTGSNADSVLLGNGSARAISAIKIDTVSLSNRINAKATGSGTANGTNTGDETLTSIKTKLGAATSVSDGYLKYQDYVKFDGKEPSFSKNTAFNKNFGTTTGTVLEGRTFGTAANSAVGDFQPIENQRVSTTNSPSFNRLTSTVATGTAPLTVNSTTMVGNLNAQFINGTNLSRIISEKEFGNTGLYLQNNTVSWVNSAIDGAGGITSWVGNFLSFGKNDISYKTQFLTSKTDFKFRVTYGNEDTQFNTIYHSGNLTSTLTTNYIPKWNGSSFVNATAGTDYQLPITLTTNGTSGAATFSGNVLNVPNYTSSGSFIQNQTTSAQAGGLWVSGIIQTNNTLYAATVASNHVDVGEINTTISGTSGNATFIQPFRGIAYKKVIINLNGFVGNVNWSYPTAFTNTPVIVMTDGLGATLITSKSTTSVAVISATATTGILILEGY